MSLCFGNRLARSKYEAENRASTQIKALRQFRTPQLPLSSNGMGDIPDRWLSGCRGYAHPPQWRADHRHELSKLIRSRISNTQRKVFEQAEREGRERWAKIQSDVERELTPTPYLHFLVYIAHSPGGTLFPRYLVRG